MNAKAKLSEKGQIVIPKDVRDALALLPGQTFDVFQFGGSILLKPENQSQKSGRSFEEITASIRSRYTHKGPPVSISDMNAAIDQMFREGRSDTD